MANPWGEAADQTKQNDTFSSADVAVVEEKHFDILHPFDDTILPIDGWVNDALDWVVLNFRDFFQASKMPIETTLNAVEKFLTYLSPWVIILFFVFISLQFANKKIAMMSFVSLIFIGLIGAWNGAMITLSLVITSVLFSIILGLPLGILCAKNDRVESVIKPILDAMQTTPAFVYLIPIVMLFGIGNVPGVIVTIIFALPPLIRLTNLGIRQVPDDLIEASRSFGSGPFQMLYKVQIPVAMPTIMAGVNQTLMLALSMVVIASMIAVGGLGQMVLRGIGRLDIGLAATGGIGIVLLAIILDRLTHEMGKEKKQKRKKWYEAGPIGLIYNLTKKEKR